jgi:hypothetical protein
MFHVYDKLTYSEDDWRIMKLALARAGILLDRPVGHPDADVLARTVMSVFDWGFRDSDVIATMVAEHARGKSIQSIFKQHVRPQPFVPRPSSSHPLSKTDAERYL